MKTRHLFFLVIAFFLITHCKKDKGTLSTVETYAPRYIASTAATIGCYVESDGGAGIASCGVYLSYDQDPETTGAKLQMGNDTGLYLGKVTGLQPNTQYFMKAYATNSEGEALGEQVNFITPGTISDYDGSIYETVNIGTQMWMAENLKTTRYLNGDVISTTNPATLDISSENSPKYQWSYGGTEGNTQTYGKLYTWYTVMDTRKVCPTGWHIPTDAEWTTLENTLGSYLIAGSRLKEAGNSHWQSPYNIDATDESCFTALPAGYRDLTGTFYVIQNDAYWWSATESEAVRSYARKLNAVSPSVSRQGVIKSWGLSVRCIKD